MSYRLLFLLHLLFSMLFFAQKTDSTRIFNAPYTFKYEKLAVPAVMVGAGTTLLLTTDREIKYHGQNYGWEAMRRTTCSLYRWFPVRRSISPA